MRKTVIAALMGCLTWTLTARPADPEPPQTILQRAIGAHGGERLLKTPTLIRSAKGEFAAFPQALPFTGEAQFQLPDKARLSFEVDSNQQKSLIVLVVNGAKGWRSSGGATQEMTARELAETSEEVYISWVITLLPLLDGQFKLSPLPEIKVNGEAAAGFKAARKDRPDVKLYFDKKTDLLAKAEWQGREAGLEVKKEYLWSGYKEFEGVKLPTKYLVQFNGKRVVEWTVTGYKFPEKVEDSVFGKP